VIAQSMEQSVGISSNTRRGQGYQRAERRRLALQRQLIERVTIDVGVKRRVILHQIAARNFNDRRLPTDGQSCFQRNRHRRPHIDVLTVGSISVDVYGDMIRVQGKIGELIMALIVRRGGPGVTADWIFDLYGGTRHNCAC